MLGTDNGGEVFDEDCLMEVMCHLAKNATAASDDGANGVARLIQMLVDKGNGLPSPVSYPMHDWGQVLALIME